MTNLDEIMEESIDHYSARNLLSPSKQHNSPKQYSAMKKSRIVQDRTDNEPWLFIYAS
jgi:hypothetical protein